MSAGSSSAPPPPPPPRVAGIARPPDRTAGGTELSGASGVEPGTEAPYPATAGCARTTTPGRVWFVRPVDTAAARLARWAGTDVVPQPCVPASALVGGVIGGPR